MLGRAELRLLAEIFSTANHGSAQNQPSPGSAFSTAAFRFALYRTPALLQMRRCLHPRRGQRFFHWIKGFLMTSNILLYRLCAGRSFFQRGAQLFSEPAAAFFQREAQLF